MWEKRVRSMGKKWILFRVSKWVFVLCAVGCVVLWWLERDTFRALGVQCPTNWWVPLAMSGGAVLLAAVCWGLEYVALVGARLESGRCWKCGYERSGLGKDAACPECGAVYVKT